MDAEKLETDGDWQKKESLTSVLAQIGVVGALLALAVLFAYQRGVDRQTSTAAIERARELLRLDTTRDLHQALETLKPALASSQRGGDAHAVSARVLAELGVLHGETAALSEAQQHLEQARAEESGVEEVAAADALLSIGAGKAADAVAQLEPLTHKGARRLDLEYVLARAQLASSRPDLALETLHRAAAIASKEPRIHALRAELLFEAGETKEAVESYRRALAGNAQHPTARLGLAIAQLRTGGDLANLDSTVASLRGEGLLSAAMEQRATDARVVRAAAIAVDAP